MSCKEREEINKITKNEHMLFVAEPKPNILFIIENRGRKRSHINEWKQRNLFYKHQILMNSTPWKQQQCQSRNGSEHHSWQHVQWLRWFYLLWSIQCHSLCCTWHTHPTFPESLLFLLWSHLLLISSLSQTQQRFSTQTTKTVINCQN